MSMSSPLAAPEFPRLAGAGSAVGISSDLSARLLSEPESRESVEWAESVLPMFDLDHGVKFRLSDLDLDEDTAFRVSVGILAAIAVAARAAGAPKATTIEVDRPQLSTGFGADGWRSLLPHHDGQHCTYLTPSLLDDPTFDPALRVFSDRSHSITSDNHKILQGIFLASPGEGASVTTYYDWVAVVTDAYARAHGTESPDVVDVARWLGGNIRSALRTASRFGLRYLSVGAALGATDPALHAMHLFGHEDFPEQAYEALPGLRERTATCPCETCGGPGLRVLCWSLHETLGIDFARFRRRYEVGVHGERHDLILADNLRVIHAQPMSHVTRRLARFYLVVAEARGEEYERWVAGRWRVPRVVHDA